MTSTVEQTIDLDCINPVIPFNKDGVPEILRAQNNWVVWRYEAFEKKSKPNKTPFNAHTGRRASSKNPSTWCSFDEAVLAWSRGGYSGLMFAFPDKGDFCGVDLDECIDDDGMLVVSAQEIVDQLDTYTEISPSGTGVKAFAIGRKPQGARCKSKAIRGFKETEIYCEARFFAVTGCRLTGSSTTIQPRQKQIEALCARLWPKPINGDKPTLRLVGREDGEFHRIDDNELITRAKCAKNGDAFASLWNGDTSGHGDDDSAADLALCSHLAFWTGGNAARIDRLFRESGLYRAKWNRQDYRDMTISKALEGCGEHYSPSRSISGRMSSHNSKQPSILIAPDEHRVVDEAIAALGADPDLYQRGGMLVRAKRDAKSRSGISRPRRSVTIQNVPAANLRDRLTRLASFHRVDRRNVNVDAHPPGWLVAAVEARGHWPQIRSLVGIADAPILRPDGSICQKPGYDAKTEVLMLPGQQFAPIKDSVSIDDARVALAELLDVVRDFRFESPEHKAAWVAALLTPLARYAYAGPTPLFLIDANVRGAGKGLLAQCIGHIVQGCEMPVSSYSHDTEEMRKKITSIAIAGDRMVLLDNLEGTLGNDALDRALTTTRWKDRVLGRSEQVDLPLTTIWYATGNNVLVGADTARRIVHIRLDVLEERPELRSDFAHPDLVRWIGEHRPKLLVAALTILAAYCRAGMPKAELEAFGSFEGWSNLVRQAVVWVGLPDPCTTRYRLTETADTTAETLRQLFAAWIEYDPTSEGLILATLIKSLYPQHEAPMDEASCAMRAALEEISGSTRGKYPTARQLGNRLRHFRRRVIDGLYLDQDRSQRRCGLRWRLLPTGGKVSPDV